MPNGLKVFVVYGRQEAPKDALRALLSDLGVEPCVLSRARRLGRSIPDELQRVVRDCDAAVVLATADDVGGLVGAAAVPRARENIWLELGWFWSAVGLERTLLLTEETIEPPSDLQGIFRLTFNKSPVEVRAEIADWLRDLMSTGADAGVDLVRSTTETGARNADYQAIHSLAEHELIITGIGMMNVRQDLPTLGGVLETRPRLCITFVVPSAKSLSLHRNEDLMPYRRSILGDVDAFITDLRASSLVEKYNTRVRLYRYPKFMTFVATAADLGETGRLMLVEFPLETTQHGLVERPRLLLKKRTVGGLYDRFSAAIRGSLSSSEPETIR